ncbi:MAG: helix-turn-helix domain-containing protein [Acidobacteriota bacterium]
MSLFTGKDYDIYCKLITDLHECLDLSQFKDILLDGVNSLIPTSSAIFLVFNDVTGEAIDSRSFNIDKSLFSHYRDHYQKHDIYKDLIHNLSMPPAVNRSSDFLDYKNWNKNEHRGEFLLPQGIYNIACMEFTNGQHTIMASLSLHRDKQQGDFSDREMEILKVLLPCSRSIYNSIILKGHLIESSTEINHLTAREIQVLPLLLQNMPNEDIAENLSVSLNTVKTHVRHILAKTGCSSRAELISRHLMRLCG